MNAPRFQERAAIFALFCVLSVSLAVTIGSAEVIGPTPYLQLSDSPFDGMTFSYFHVDDMEDGALNTPGVTASVGAAYGPSSITDSVDEDDGAVDGSGTGGYSFFSGNGLAGIQFTFDESVLGTYPTHVGIVWTDGTDDIQFTAYDRYDMVIGSLTGAHADDNFFGGTGEDRFYGIVSMAGVKSIAIKNSVPGGSAGIEVDHIQYGGAAEDPDECKYTLAYDGATVPILPVTGETSAVDFYSYDNPAATSANTGLEKSNSARFWIYEDPVSSELSLFVVIDTPDDEDGGDFSLAVSGAPSGASLLVEDDDSDALSWDSAGGSGTAEWNWDPCCTDGWVVGYLAGSWDLVLTPSNAVGIDRFEFVSASATGDPEIIEIPMDGSFTISRVCDEEPPPATGSCPRGPGFWKQQCAQKGNGSTKYSREDVEKIAACADENSEYFDWDEGDAFSGFCHALDPPKPMSEEKQLKRKFATMLANICAGELGLIANNGSTVSRDRNTPLDCDGVGADTVDELISEIDDALEAGSGYGPLLECLEYVNEYLEDDCDDDDVEDDGDNEVEHHMGIETPSPNPFRLSTTFNYSVPGDQSQMVSIRIYNVAGRLIRTLVSETKSPGRYEIGWDGRDANGRQASRGVYFVRGVLDGQSYGAPARVLYLR
jgi:hypothetical protein